MAEYRTPGAYVEEPTSRQRVIEAAETATAGFAGLAKNRGTTAAPVLVTSSAHFTRAFGDAGDVMIGNAPAPDYLAHAVRAFFDNSGARLYVAPVADAISGAAWQDAIARLATVEAVSVISAPGSASLPAPLSTEVAQALVAAAAAAGSYRFAVLDPPPALDLAGIRAFRGAFDSRSAALYYPWVVAHGVAVPPSGAVCGLYAHVDPSKAPANQVVRGVTGLQREVALREQEELNPLGINCIRRIAGRGIRVWGARTLSSDPEWKYVNVRRYADYLERSLARGTQWAVFERNAEPLWAEVRAAVTDFLLAEWRRGTLLGAKPEQAFFVRCDATTMTQNDLDNGRLVCLVGFAAVRPAEFVILRIGQWTADCKNC